MQKRPPKRRPRLSEQETTDRMLQAGLEMVDEAGLHVSFDLLRLEEVIKRADVSRVAVYRHWVTKEAYFTDLLVALAERGDQPAFRLTEGFGARWNEIAANLDVHNPESRRAALVEICRIGADGTAEALANDKPLAIRLALYASLVSLQDNDAVKRLAAAMQESEAASALSLREDLEKLGTTLGYRSRELEFMTFERICALGMAFVTGQAFQAHADPEPWRGTVETDPFNTGVTRPWSLVAMGFTGLILSLIEPDPDWQPPAR